MVAGPPEEEVKDTEIKHTSTKNKGNIFKTYTKPLSSFIKFKEEVRRIISVKSILI